MVTLQIVLQFKGWSIDGISYFIKADVVAGDGDSPGMLQARLNGQLNWVKKYIDGQGQVWGKIKDLVCINEGDANEDSIFFHFGADDFYLKIGTEQNPIVAEVMCGSGMTMGVWFALDTNHVEGGLEEKYDSGWKGLDLGKNVTAVGDDFSWDNSGRCGKEGQSMPVGMGSPHIRIENVAGTATLCIPFSSLQPDRLVTIGDILSDTDWRNSQYYRDWCKPHDVFHVMACDISASGGIYGFRLTRSEREAPFGAAERAQCARLLPHQRRALNLHQVQRRDQRVHSLYSQAMAQLMVGAIVLDEHGKVIECNPMAAAIVKLGDGGVLGCWHGHVYDPGQHLHPVLRLLFRGHRPPRCC